MRGKPYLQNHPDTTLDAERLMEDGTTAYPIPKIPHIGNGAERLYALESRRDELIKKCAQEQGRVMGIAETTTAFWHEAVPEALASVLESFQPGAAVAAAVGFLRKHGFTVIDIA